MSYLCCSYIYCIVGSLEGSTSHAIVLIYSSSRKCLDPLAMSSV